MRGAVGWGVVWYGVVMGGLWYGGAGWGGIGRVPPLFLCLAFPSFPPLPRVATSRLHALVEAFPPLPTPPNRTEEIKTGMKTRYGAKNLTRSHKIQNLNEK